MPKPIRERVKDSRCYALTKIITFLMDRCMLDPILGFVPALDSAIGIFCTGIYVYVAISKIGSTPLALAVIYNFLRDTVIGLIPLLGNILDFFNRSYIRSQNLIEGFLDQDETVVRKVNSQARLMVILVIACLVLIGLLSYISIYLISSIIG